MTKKSTQNHFKEVEQILAQAKNGDTLAEGTLIQMLEPLVKNRCRHYFGVCDEDMLQLGNIRLVELIRAFDHTRCDNRFVGYADRMISCYYWNLKKSEIRKTKELTQTDYAEDQLKLVQYNENGFEKIEIGELLSALSPEQREIIQQNVMHGKTLDQVARCLCIQRERAKYQKKKALETLRRLVDR